MSEGNFISRIVSARDRSRDTESYIAKQTEDGKIVFKCTMCEKTNNRKHHIINHVESVHFPNLFRYSCHYCEKEYKTKNSLDVHLSTVHRGDKQHLRQFV